MVGKATNLWTETRRTNKVGLRPTKLIGSVALFVVPPNLAL